MLNKYKAFLFFPGDSTSSYYTTECYDKLEIFKKCLVNALRGIEKGSILISDLHLIHENNKQFSILLKNMNQVQTGPSIEIRMKELEIFELKHNTIQKFADFCQIIRGKEHSYLKIPHSIQNAGEYY